MLAIEIIGNLGADAQVKESNGRRFVNFSVADSAKIKDANGNPVEKTTWISCFLNGDGGRLTPYLKKGTPVFVRGRVSVDVYRRNDGGFGAALTCNVDELNLLPSKREGQAPGQGNDAAPF